MPMVTVIKRSTYRCLHFFTIAPYIQSVFLCKGNQLQQIITWNLKIKLTLNYFKKSLIHWILKTPLTLHGFEILPNLKKLCFCSQTKSKWNHSFKTKSWYNMMKICYRKSIKEDADKWMQQETSPYENVFFKNIIWSVLIKFLRSGIESKKGLPTPRITKCFHLGYQYILAN